MKKIKTFEDACKALKIATTLPDVSSWPGELQQHVIAEYKLIIIAKALNGKWQPNWDNDDEYKYYPYFYMGSAGGGFRFRVFVFVCARSGVGSRLCFKTRELAAYAGEQFVSLYKDYMLG